MKGIDRYTIKWVAMISMLIDHLGYALIHQTNTFTTVIGTICYAIGRLAFPLFVYLLVDGFIRTRSKERFFLRLLIFALISEVPYDLAQTGRILNIGSQNVMWTLMLGFAFMWFADLVLDKDFFLNVKWIGIVMLILLGVIVTFTAITLHTDYGAYGVTAIIIQYLFVRLSKKLPDVWGIRTDLFGFMLVIILLVYMKSGEIFAAPAVLLIWNYYRKAVKKMPKLIGYAFYPAHLLVIGLISIALNHVTGGLVGEPFAWM